MSQEVLLISGELTTEEEADQAYINEIEPPTIVSKRIQIIAKYRAYLVDDDVVRDFDITGVVGSMTQFEPSLEDRREVDTHRIASLLAAQDIDVHDVKELLEFYLMNNSGTSNYALDEKVQRAFHELGGLQ